MTEYRLQFSNNFGKSCRHRMYIHDKSEALDQREGLQMQGGSRARTGAYREVCEDASSKGQHSRRALIAESSYRLKITDWPEDERPREKAIKKGIGTLSDAELLGLLISKGTREKTAIDLGRELIARYGDLKNLSARSPSEYSAIKGIGSTKAITIAATFELSRRVQIKKESKIIAFRRSQDVADYYRPLMQDLKKEFFKVVLLNGANRFIKDVTVSEGTLNSSIVHPREVFREALIEAAAGIILIHNHPSGDPTPSEEDKKVTGQLVEAGKIFGIKVFDHVIVARDGYKSFADEGML